MSFLNREQRIDLFMSLFTGREDVYAYRWESRGGKKGYAPAYADSNKKQYIPFTKNVVEQHLLGNQTIGVYPFLTYNTSRFVVADFDTPDCLNLLKRLIEVCRERGIETYIERSQSGSGFHAWWFFEQAYPAYKSRKIFLTLLKNAGIIDQFDKTESFDRLFPNQDYLSGKGLGNLIALPLQGSSRKRGATVFLDPENDFRVAKDQWGLLQGIKRISMETLDKLFEISTQNRDYFIENDTTMLDADTGSVPITISTHIVIPKKAVSKNFANFLSDHLHFFNTEYAVKQKMGLSTHNTERFFNTIEKSDEHIFLPRGFFSKFTSFLGENNIPYTIRDARIEFDSPTKVSLSCPLFVYQEKAVHACLSQDTGILVAPPGSGKTIMGLSLVAARKQPSLIITHRKQIYEQWLERIEQFMGISKKNIGQITSTKKVIRSPITVATIQTLARMVDTIKDEMATHFGCIIVDECHHIPAKMFRRVITQLSPKYLYGLTATPMRKHNDERLMFLYLGENIYEVSKEDIKQNSSKDSSDVKIYVQETELSFPFTVHTRNYQTVSKMLIADTKRNEQIIADVTSEIEQGKKCLLLTERKEHVKIFQLYLGKKYETITLTGGERIMKRKQKIEQIKSGHFQVIIATGQYIGEGMHFDDLDSLFLVYPCSFSGKLTQYIGRVLHSDNSSKNVYDYRDSDIPYFERMFKKRKKYYEKEYGGNSNMRTLL